VIWLRPDECREDVESSETWKGEAGTITFNWLQQYQPVEFEEPLTPVEEAGTTDIWGING